jgi:rhodanese-related sulfurtransferase
VVEDVDTETLRTKIDSGDVVLVDALSPISYAVSRLPGAINIPPGTEEERAPRRIPDRGSAIVVYCMSPTCRSSVTVANRLVELGYRNVRHYSGGKESWIAAGLPLEGGRA